MRISDAFRFPENITPVLQSKSPPNMTPQLPHDPNFHRRTLRKPVVYGSLVSRWQNESPATRHRGRKLRKPNHFAGVLAARRMLSRPLSDNDEKNLVSARKLAAGLWKLTAAEIDIAAADGGGGGGGILYYEWFDPLRLKHESSLPYSEFPLEGTTKWDQRYRNISTVASRKLSEFPLEVVLCLKKLGEEKASWMRKERQKLRIKVDNLNNELKKERLGRKTAQIANSQLLNDIADAKSAVKEIEQNCEKERKARESMEEACHDLAKKIEENEIKMEGIKRQSLKLREQLEVERKMLEMADVLREERVKIKMADAKLIFEEKFCQLNNLIADLEDFLKSKDKSLNMIEISEGQVIRQATKSAANIKEVIDLMCSTIDYHQNNQVRTTECNPSLDSRCVQNGSKIGDNSLQRPFSVYTDECMKRIARRTNLATSGSKGHESLKSEIIDMCSAILAKKLTKKSLSIRRQLKSSIRDSDDANKIIPVERRRRFGKRSFPKMGRVSPAGTLVEGGLGHDNTVQQGNPHIIRAMKGCLEWPQGMSKNGMKRKLLDSEAS